VLAAMGLMAALGGLLGTCGVVGLVALGASAEQPPGVLVGAQVPDTTVEALKARKLLQPQEAVLAFHDATLRLDMSEVTFVTKSRVVHAHGDKVSAVALADVSKITHHTEALGLDVVDFVTKDGKSLRIEIAPLNGGESYVDVIEDAWRIHFPEATVTRPAAKAQPQR
jgi:hypothetical protein